MPELPEVENVVISLNSKLNNSQIIDVKINKQNLSNVAYS